MRGASALGSGFNEGLARAVGGLPDLVGSGLSALGVPGIQPGYYTNAARSGLQALTGEAAAPETTTEKALYGAGRGAAEAGGMLIPGAALSRLGQAGGLAQGVGQALTAQPLVQAAAGAVGGAVSDMTGNELAGLAASIAAPVGAAGAARFFQPIRNSLNPEMVRLAEQATAEGIPLTAAQATGSRPLRLMESSFDQLPFTAGPQAEVRDAQQRAFNRAVLSRAGAGGDSASPATLQANRDRIGGEFERLSQGTTVNLDDQMLSDLQDVATRYGTKLPSQQRPAFQAYIEDILGQGDGMPGTVYQQARSDLSRQARSAKGNDPFFSDALRGLRDALDNAAGRSIAPDDQAAWQQARSDWRYQRQIENAMAGAGQDAATGNVPAAQLRTAAVSGDRSGYARGDGELNDLARIGQAFLRAPPDSGTAGRSSMMNLLQLAGAGGAGAVGGLPAVAAALVAPRVVQGVTNSGVAQRYLKEGAPGAKALNRFAPDVNRALIANILAARGLDASQSEFEQGRTNPLARP